MISLNNFLNFDILCFPESQLDMQISNRELLRDTFDQPYGKDRTNHGGGLLIYLNSDIVQVRRHDLKCFVRNQYG